MLDKLIPEFIPGSELELQLVQMQLDNRISDHFLDTLFSSQLVLLTDKEPHQDVRADSLTPLIIRNQQGERLLAIFTNLTIASEKSSAFTPFQYGFVVAGEWVIGNLSEQLGIALNPGSQIGVEIPAKHIQTIKQQLQQTLQKNQSA